MLLSHLERRVLEMIFSGDHPLLEQLRLQVQQASVKSREFSGAGFFTEFEVQPELKVVQFSTSRLQVGDVIAEIDGLRYGAGFVVYIENGLISMLEGYSYEEAWPEYPEPYRLKYKDDTRENFFQYLLSNVRA